MRAPRYRSTHTCRCPADGRRQAASGAHLPRRPLPSAPPPRAHPTRPPTHHLVVDSPIDTVRHLGWTTTTIDSGFERCRAMHITSGLSPASGESPDAGLDLYGESGECFAVEHTVPESSHTVEIEYVYEQPETYAINQDDIIHTDITQYNQPNRDAQNSKILKKKQRPEKMMVDEDSDPDLTNLTWLQNITNIMQVAQFPMSPGPPAKAPQPQNTRLHKFNQTIAKCQKDFTENKEEYQSNSEKKPPYSYSTLICMAMRYNNDKMTLSAIYSWIKEHFKYYRSADPTWQNSIRHNLSLNKVFVKVARSKQEPGKGGFWKLDLAHLEGGQRTSNRPPKKKKNSKAPESVPASLPLDNDQLVSDIAHAVTLHLPELNLEGVPMQDIELQSDVGANVIVEPAIPPPLIPDDDLSSLLLNPPDWDDLQLDMLDNYLGSCFK